jgi:GDP-D-mannose 3', 5'-epimerase
MKKALVLGAGGFIGSHLVKRLVEEKYYVVGIDLKYPEFSETKAHIFIIGDLRDMRTLTSLRDTFDEVYQLAADMGGAGYIFTGEHDAGVMHNSASINLNVSYYCAFSQIIPPKVFYSSSACVYPYFNQLDERTPYCEETTAYPAHPDSEYGWEKLFSERLYKAYERNHGVDVRIARFHNIFGPEGTYTGGKEKAPAALCRKVIEAEDCTYIDVWGDGVQTRSFLYIDECIEGIRRLMEASQSHEPLNIGSEEMISIDELAKAVIAISGKHLVITHIEGTQGVRGRCSHNEMIKNVLHWEPNYPLQKGLEKTYEWINSQIIK